MLAIRLPRGIEDRLDKLAKKTGRTKTYYAREAILVYLADQESIHQPPPRLAKNRKRIPLPDVGRPPAREERLSAAEIHDAVRRLGLSTPAESTRMIREDRDAR
jgi:RHH-type rel operon transcriptional repressor/antitoxin RelB